MELNNWTYQQKGLYLAVSLRGLAQNVLGNLPAEDKKFESLTKAIRERFSPASPTELYRLQLKERELKHGENVGQRILRLITHSYPGADPNLISVFSM